MTTTAGRQEELTPGSYEVVINPFQPQMLWVYGGRKGTSKTNGDFLGVARRAANLSRADREGNASELGREQARYRALAAQLKERHADIAREEARRLKHVNDVIEGPRSPEGASAEETRRTTVLTEEDLAALSPRAPEESEPAVIDISDVSAKDFI